MAPTLLSWCCPWRLRLFYDFSFRKYLRCWINTFHPEYSDGTDTFDMEKMSEIIYRIETGEADSLFARLLVRSFLKDTLDTSRYLAVFIGVEADVVALVAIEIVLVEYLLLVDPEGRNEAGIVLIQVEREAEKLPLLPSRSDFVYLNHYLLFEWNATPTPLGPQWLPAVGLVGTMRTSRS